MKEMSDQTRIVIASALSLAVIVVWGLLYKPATPPPQPLPLPKTASAIPGNPGATQSAPKASAATTPASSSAIADTSEKTIVVESDLYRVVLSNRGAVVHDWKLKKYTDAN